MWYPPDGVDLYGSLGVSPVRTEEVLDLVRFIYITGGGLCKRCPLTPFDRDARTVPPLTLVVPQTSEPQNR